MIFAMQAQPVQRNHYRLETTKKGEIKAIAKNQHKQLGKITVCETQRIK